MELLLSSLSEALKQEELMQIKTQVKNLIYGEIEFMQKQVLFYVVMVE